MNCLEAEITGRSVRVWMSGREFITVRVESAWSAYPGGGRLPRRVRLWRRGNSAGWRLRADTTGVYVGVGALLMRSGRPEEPPGDTDDDE